MNGFLVSICVLVLQFVFLVFSPHAHAQKLIPKTSLILVDANGKKVGSVVGIVNDRDGEIVALNVAIAIGNIPFVLTARREELSGNPNLSLWFLTTDCSGPAFLLDDELPSSTSPLPPVVVDNNNFAFVGKRTLRFQTSGMQTWRTPSGGGCRVASPELRFFVPTALVDLNIFAPPFTAK
jgi:hypothetical protein